VPAANNSIAAQTVPTRRMFKVIAFLLSKILHGRSLKQCSSSTIGMKAHANPSSLLHTKHSMRGASFKADVAMISAI
jgi:hypothetical protein